MQASLSAVLTAVPGCGSNVAANGSFVFTQAVCKLFLSPTLRIQDPWTCLVKSRYEAEYLSQPRQSMCVLSILGLTGYCRRIWYSTSGAQNVLQLLQVIEGHAAVCQDWRFLRLMTSMSPSPACTQLHRTQSNPRLLHHPLKARHVKQMHFVFNLPTSGTP